jgi:hypothetical protein
LAGPAPVLARQCIRQPGRCTDAGQVPVGSA